MLVAVREEVVVGLEAEVELPDEVGQHQEDDGETKVLADAATPPSLEVEKEVLIKELDKYHAVVVESHAVRSSTAHLKVPQKGANVLFLTVGRYADKHHILLKTVSNLEWHKVLGRLHSPVLADEPLRVELVWSAPMKLYQSIDGSGHQI